MTPTIGFGQAAEPAPQPPAQAGDGAPAEPDPPPAPPPATSTERAAVSRVIMDITREGRACWKRNESWPRETASHVRDRGFPLHGGYLADVLTRRMGRDPALEGYVKWQLLGYGPDFTGFTIEQYRQVLVNIPDLIDYPQATSPAQQTASRQQRSSVNVGLPGVGIGAGGAGGSGYGLLDQFRGGAERVNPVDALRQRAEAVQKAHVVIQHANFPILKYRDALAREIPDTLGNGVRAVLLMKDTIDRVKAGDRSYTVPLDKLAHTCRKINEGLPVPQRVRHQLIAGLRTLGKLETTVLVAVRPLPGAPATAQETHETIAVDKGILKYMASQLLE